MSYEDDIELRSQALDKIRGDLRRLADRATVNPRRDNFEISYEAAIELSSSEERAMVRQMEASYEDDFFIGVSFRLKRRRKKPQVSVISLHIRRRKRKTRRE